MLVPRRSGAMTEEEWLTSTDPAEMLTLLTGKATGRKLRLLACAACRENTPPSPYPRRDEILAIAERYADGEATEQERVAAFATTFDEDFPIDYGYYLLVAFAVGESSDELGTHLRKLADGESSMKANPAMIRELFAYPFHPASFDPQWRTATVVAMARGMYETRDFSAMPIVADALEDAGCEDADILDHCRGGSAHIRGCWVVDRILGME
jgi:hypothetical protein